MVSNTFVTNTSQRTVKPGNAIKVNESLPVMAGVAGTTGSFFKMVDGKLAVATADDSNIVFAFNLPAEKTSFNVGDSVNVSSNGMFYGEIETGEVLVVGDALMIGTTNSTIKKHTTGVAFATAREIVGNVVAFQLFGK